MYSHCTGVHTDTPRCPRAAGGQEILLLVAGLLGAYVCTKLDTTQSLREWEYFWHEHCRCSRGQGTIRNSAALSAQALLLQLNV